MTYGVIIFAFLILALAELRFPARRGRQDQSRVTLNFVVGIASHALPTIVPVSVVFAAEIAGRAGWGLFNGIEAAPWLVLGVALLALSFSGYWTHRFFHEIPFLWRFHQLHHSDSAIDLSSGLRGHPLGTIIAALITMPVVFALGPAPNIVLLAATLLFVANLFLHANIRLPDAISRHLERIFVTPAMHLIHHVPERALHDSNYGDFFSFWDRMFGTYRAGDSLQSGTPALGLNDGIPDDSSGFLARLLLRKAPG